MSSIDSSNFIKYRQFHENQGEDISAQVNTMQSRWLAEAIRSGDFVKKLNKFKDNPDFFRGKARQCNLNLEDSSRCILFLAHLETSLRLDHKELFNKINFFVLGILKSLEGGVEFNKAIEENQLNIIKKLNLGDLDYALVRYLIQEVSEMILSENIKIFSNQVEGIAPQSAKGKVREKLTAKKLVKDKTRQAERTTAAAQSIIQAIRENREGLNLPSEIIRYNDSLQEEGDDYLDSLEKTKKTTNCRSIEKRKKSSKKSGKKKKGKNLKIKEDVIIKKEENVLKNSELVITSTPLSTYVKFSNQLQKQQPYQQLWRVTEKWRPWSMDKLRDNLKSDPGYSELQEDDLRWEQAKHLLPGIDKIIANPLASRVYCFQSERGLGVFCRLILDGKERFGVVYYGIDEVEGHKRIYHRYFEEIAPEDIASKLQSGELAKGIFEQAVKDGECDHEVDKSWSIQGLLSVSVNEDAHVIIDHDKKLGGLQHRAIVYPIWPEHLSR